MSPRVVVRATRSWHSESVLEELSSLPKTEYIQILGYACLISTFNWVTWAPLCLAVARDSRPYALSFDEQESIIWSIKITNLRQHLDGIRDQKLFNFYNIAVDTVMNVSLTLYIIRWICIVSDSFRRSLYDAISSTLLSHSFPQTAAELLLASVPTRRPNLDFPIIC